MSAIDFKTLPANVPSMCIPRVFKNITRERVAGVFRDLDIGVVERIDMIQKENEKGEKFQRVFIHFSKWNTTANALRAREMLLSGKEIKVIYDEPWFWKISANKSVAKTGGGGDGKPRPAQRKKPQISFDDSPRASASVVAPPVASAPVAPLRAVHLAAHREARSPSSSPPTTPRAAGGGVRFEVEVEDGEEVPPQTPLKSTGDQNVT